MAIFIDFIDRNSTCHAINPRFVSHLVYVEDDVFGVCTEIHIATGATDFTIIVPESMVDVSDKLRTYEDRHDPDYIINADSYPPEMMEDMKRHHLDALKQYTT